MELEIKSGATISSMAMEASSEKRATFLKQSKWPRVDVPADGDVYFYFDNLIINHYKVEGTSGVEPDTSYLVVSFDLFHHNYRTSGHNGLGIILRDQNKIDLTTVWLGTFPPSCKKTTHHQMRNDNVDPKYFDATKFTGLDIDLVGPYKRCP